MDPGETVLTRIPAGASASERFLLRLVSAAFDAVYATSSGDWRRGGGAGMFTIRAHGARLSRGSAARTHRLALTVPISKGACRPASSRSSKRPGPTSTGPAAFARTF